jgi:SAM-dependent methyltransferase
VKPFSEACEENKHPILQVLQRVLAERRRVLEVGSGTGQHAAWLPRFLPHLVWLPSDRPEHLPGIRAWVEEAALANVEPPRALDVNQDDWGVRGVDAVFSANTVHIMHWPSVERFLAGVGRLLPAGGIFALYGPFSRGGRHTSESNARFDAWLRERDPGSGVRDLDDLEPLAAAAGLALVEDVAMPVNNRTLIWRRGDMAAP